MIHLLLVIIYLSFISLGLPDSLLGSAWPAMYSELSVPISYVGIISMIIAVATILSSLMSDRLMLKFGTGKITAFSVAATAIALIGFSCCSSFWMLCLWAVPYGLGAGSVDAALNNYVALHYSSRHMSWLHCMWGIGASVGPYIMGYVLTGGGNWNMGYRLIGFLQLVLTAILFLSLPLWKRNTHSFESSDKQIADALSLAQILRIPGAKEIMISFFCYSAIEQTAGLWAGSYLVLHKGISSETAAAFSSLFFVGITFGRALNGFLTIKFSDMRLIYMGEGIIALGILILLFPLHASASLVGFVLIGLGCAPIYPCIIHCTPSLFGADKSHALIGVQMASAYTGTCLMPPLFGLIATHIQIALLPFYLLILLIVMALMQNQLKKAGEKH